MSALKEVLERVLDGERLRAAEARAALGMLADPEENEARKAAFLAALRARGETSEEVLGFALGMRDAALAPPIPVDGPALVDTCGTGGDGAGSLNVSTATALVVAGAGLRVVKHGNRSVSSRSGSADVLEALGFHLSPDPASAADLLAKSGFTFLFAPSFHPAMKQIMPVRRAMGVRTVFNILGPLTNPARPAFQLVGAFSPEAGRLMAGALAGLGVQRAFVVHGDPGWDEATPCGPFWRWDVRDGQVREERLDPAEVYGLPRCAPEALAGGDAAENARHLLAMLEGERGPHRDAVLLNAALLLEAAGLGEGQEALALAAEAVDSGKARAVVEAARGA